MAVAQQEFIDQNQVFLDGAQDGPEIRLGLRRRVANPPDRSGRRFPAGANVVSVKILEAQPLELTPEGRIAESAGVLGRQLLEIEGADGPLEVEGQEDLEPAETSFLIDAVDVADEDLPR